MPDTTDARTRILIIDDHRAFSEALSIAIGIQPDLECIGVEASLEAGLEALATLHPDVILLDVHLPDGSGIDAVTTIKQRWPDARILMLTADPDPSLLARAANAGAAGYLLKERPLRDVLRMLRSATEGGFTVDSETAAHLFDRPGPTMGASEDAPHITPREQDVLVLMGQGHDPKTIARALGLSHHTVRGHIKSLFAKLGAHSQLSAVIIAVRTGLLPGASNDGDPTS